jgi:DNA invertase Pin-like site-specific DNA recombinase
MAYLRTSSATNVGPDKDSDRRQREAIEAFAKRAGYEIVGEFYDAVVSGADPVETRPGFAEMLQRIAGNSARTIIVETANRFARALMVQEVGYAKLRELGIELIAADSPNAFLNDGPTPRPIRQVLGAVAEFDKAMTVIKLRGASAGKTANARAASPTPKSTPTSSWWPSTCTGHRRSPANADHCARSPPSSPLPAFSMSGASPTMPSRSSA